MTGGFWSDIVRAYATYLAPKNWDSFCQQEDRKQHDKAFKVDVELTRNANRFLPFK